MRSFLRTMLYANNKALEMINDKLHEHYVRYMGLYRRDHYIKSW